MKAKLMLNDLLDRGISQAEIARQLKISRASINYAKNNDSWSPAYDIGKRLEYFHKEIVYAPRKED